MSEPIYTDEHGRPFERPEAPAGGAGIEERIEYLRAYARYQDTAADCANKAFAAAFGRALKR